MGKPMAKNLLAAGFPLTVYNRSRQPMEELRTAGIGSKMMIYARMLTEAVRVIHLSSIQFMIMSVISNVRMSVNKRVTRNLGLLISSLRRMKECLFSVLIPLPLLLSLI